MKQLIIAFSVLFALALSSCTALLEPTCAENNDVLIDVYNKTYKYRDHNRYAGEPDLYANTMRFLCGNDDRAIRDISQNEKINHVEMLEWCLNESMQGNSFTGYYVTYVVKLGDERWYALIDLTEFDSGRYEWKMVDADRSLSAIQAMLY